MPAFMTEMNHITGVKGYSAASTRTNEKRESKYMGKSHFFVKAFFYLCCEFCILLDTSGSETPDDEEK